MIMVFQIITTLDRKQHKVKHF